MLLLPLRYILRLLSTWVAVGLLALLMGALDHVTVLLCHVPGPSLLPLCQNRRATPLNSPLPHDLDYSSLLGIQAQTFERLQDDLILSSRLALEIRKSEMAVIDLSVLVGISNMESKEVLSSLLFQVVQTAKEIEDGLAHVGAQIDGTLDLITAVQDYCLNIIELACSDQLALLPWSSTSQIQPIPSQIFTSAMSAAIASFEAVTSRTEILLGKLKTLEYHLISVHEIIMREGYVSSFNRKELASNLWAKLGGHRRTLRLCDADLALIDNLIQYRTQAHIHTVTAHEALRFVHSTIVDLQSRAATSNDPSPDMIEIQIATMKAGVNRLCLAKIVSQKHFLAKEPSFSKRSLTGNATLGI